jgi:hypothetical protein
LIGVYRSNTLTNCKTDLECWPYIAGQRDCSGSVKTCPKGIQIMDSPKPVNKTQLALLRSIEKAGGITSAFGVGWQWRTWWAVEDAGLIRRINLTQHTLTEKARLILARMN